MLVGWAMAMEPRRAPGHALQQDGFHLDLGSCFGVGECKERFHDVLEAFNRLPDFLDSRFCLLAIRSIAEQARVPGDNCDGRPQFVGNESHELILGGGDPPQLGRLVAPPQHEEEPADDRKRRDRKRHRRNADEPADSVGCIDAVVEPRGLDSAHVGDGNTDFLHELLAFAERYLSFAGFLAFAATRFDRGFHCVEALVDERQKGGQVRGLGGIGLHISLEVGQDQGQPVPRIRVRGEELLAARDDESPLAGFRIEEGDQRSVDGAERFPTLRPPRRCLLEGENPPEHRSDEDHLGYRDEDEGQVVPHGTHSRHGQAEGQPLEGVRMSGSRRDHQSLLAGRARVILVPWSVVQLLA
jgi:hypothetical protein